jgi:hypothetical protein
MNNQLTTTNPGGGAVAFNFFDPVQFETLQRIAVMFSNSELVPDMYRTTADNPKEKAMANCMIAFNLAQRLQADTLMVMQNLVIIHGRPSWSSKFLISTVNTCGRFEPLQYDIRNAGKLGKVAYTDYVWNPEKRKKLPVQKVFEGADIDNIECTAFTNLKGSSKELRSTTISIRMAIQEGWYTKDGSKWVTMPEQMLRYRAASFWTNAYAPELSMGMRTVEENEDISDTIDTTYTEVNDKPAASVQAEINANANKQTVDFKPTDDKPIPPADPKPAAENKETPAAGADSNPGGLFKADGPQFS